MGTVLSVFRLGDELPDVLGLVHQPVEGRHFVLSLQLVADHLANPRIVLIQPFFLHGGEKRLICLIVCVIGNPQMTHLVKT